MIGDIILWFKKIKNDFIKLKNLIKEIFKEIKEIKKEDIISDIKFWWKRLICIHDYTKNKQFYGFSYDCKKCGRHKIKEKSFWYL